MTTFIKSPSSSFALSTLRSNLTIAKVVVDFLLYAGPDGPRETIVAALGDLDHILDDSGNLLREAFDCNENEDVSLNGSRLPKRGDRPLTPDEALDFLQTSLDLIQIEVEVLLSKPWATDVEYQRTSGRRDYLIKLMGRMARYYRAAFIHNTPSTWTPELEKRFEKFLKIKV
jgi:hypothetical protein